MTSQLHSVCPPPPQVVFCRILGALFCYGYDVVTSTDVARDCLTHCAAFFRLREPQENWKLHAYSHKFICVAPYGADQLLLVNIPKVAVEEIYKVSSKTFCFSSSGGLGPVILMLAVLLSLRTEHRRENRVRTQSSERVLFCPQIGSK